MIQKGGKNSTEYEGEGRQKKNLSSAFLCHPRAGLENTGEHAYEAYTGSNTPTKVYTHIGHTHGATHTKKYTHKPHTYGVYIRNDIQTE